jgi:hypothetical protein
MSSEQKFWYKWMLNYSFGEVLGIGAAAIIGRFLFIEFSGTSSASSSNLALAILIMAGAAEGLIIGSIQWKSLSKLALHFKALPWIIVTTVSTIAGWIVVLPPAVVFISFLSKISLMNNYYSIISTILVGMAFGGLIGIPQFFIIRNFYKNASIWILANTVGWTLSFLIIYFTLFLFSANGSFIYGLFLVVSACVLSGLIQGIVTGTSLHFLMITRREHDRSENVYDIQDSTVAQDGIR